MKKKKDVFGIVLIAFICIFILGVIINKGINFYNEHTTIYLDTELVEEIYQEYDKLLEEMKQISIRLCEFDENGSCTPNPNYDFGNVDKENMLRISTRLINNSKSMLYINKKATTIKFSEYDNFLQLSSGNIHSFLNQYTTFNDEKIISNYINNVISFSANNSSSKYIFSLKNVLFNIEGKKFIEEDYMTTLKNELEFTRIIHNIMNYLDLTIQN